MSFAPCHDQPGCYVLFLSGIGRVSGHTLSYREQAFLRQLAQRVPNAVVIDDIFPYSVNNLALTGQPYFSRIWRWALARKRYGPALAGYLINIRNLFQVAHRRLTTAMRRCTARRWPRSFSTACCATSMTLKAEAPIFIIGYSGSAQMGIGAITYLREWVKGPIYMVSLGGIFGSDPGLLAADHIYHLLGSNDIAQVWRLLMPGRWPFFASSEWNRAVRQRRVTIVPMAGMGAHRAWWLHRFQAQRRQLDPKWPDHSTDDCRHHHARRRRSPDHCPAHGACCARAGCADRSGAGKDRTLVPPITVSRPT